MEDRLARYVVTVRGVVQGVGFRPFVHRLAIGLGLKGSVVNAGSHVRIDVEGDVRSLDGFLLGLRTDHPPMASITETIVTELPPRGCEGFVISESAPLTDRDGGIHIPPDTALCADCRRELSDPSDRRHGYPFINCTNCGPRFSIITGVPYDRPRTTMGVFPLCPDCLREYCDPMNRRYHAEPIACPVCGPGVTLTRTHGPTAPVHGTEAMAQARAMLMNGGILAIKGLGGYHLACNALDADTVRLLRHRKARDEKPFAVMAPNLDTVDAYCLVSDKERELLLSPMGPIVLLNKRNGAVLPDGLAPGNPRLGVMLPYTPLHVLLFGGDSPGLLVMTSGNTSGEPISYKDDDAYRRLSGMVDAFLVHDRDIHTRVDDSVVRVTLGQEEPIRRSRGYVPMPITVAGLGHAPVIACGGQSKNTFCLNRGDDFHPSHHIGDLDNMETLEAFERGIHLFTEMLDTVPKAVVHDLHPDYLSTRYALSQPLPAIAVQHHRAHVASCIADNGLDGAVIGVAFDGTGYGDDGKIWGGEFLAGDLRGLTRVGHLEYVTLPGGDSAAAEPWKAAYGYLAHSYGPSAPDLLKTIPPGHKRIVSGMLANRLNTYETSSAGRLFDAVAALCGIRSVNSFEGQAAMELEYAGMGAEPGNEGYPFDLVDAGSVFHLKTAGIIRGLVDDLAMGTDTAVMAMRFHATMARMILEGCVRTRRDHGYDRVVLSGGVLQNAVLVGLVTNLLASAGFTVYRHRRVPANDGGLSLGQAVLAQETLRERGAPHVSGLSR